MMMFFFSGLLLESALISHQPGKMRSHMTGSESDSCRKSTELPRHRCLISLTCLRLLFLLLLLLLLLFLLFLHLLLVVLLLPPPAPSLPPHASIHPFPTLHPPCSADQSGCEGMTRQRRRDENGGFRFGCSCIFFLILVYFLRRPP